MNRRQAIWAALAAPFAATTGARVSKKKAALEYDIRVIGRAQVEQALASVESTFFLHDSRMRLAQRIDRLAKDTGNSVEEIRVMAKQIGDQLAHLGEREANEQTIKVMGALACNPPAVRV